jgi:hypothetical protein
VHAVAPAVEYLPGAHATFWRPSAAGQAEPAGHTVHDDWPPTEKRPVVHATAVALVVDAHSKPAGQAVQKALSPVE